MPRLGRTQHAPRRDAKLSRQAGVRWSRRHPDSHPCTRTFRRTRRALASTIHRIEASGRVIEAAERFGQTRPATAVRQLVLVALWLSEAGTHLGRAARGLQETTVWIVLPGAPAGTLQRLGDTTAHWVDAAGRLIDVSNRLDAAFDVIRSQAWTWNGLSTRPAAQTAASLRAADGRRTPPPPSILIVEPRVAAAAVAGARKISRGRAPPSPSICTL